MRDTISNETELPGQDTLHSTLPTPHSHYEGLSYHYPVDRLWSGGSYGNMDCFARTDRLSNLDGFWHAGTNDWLCGRLDLRLELDGKTFTGVETGFYPGHQVTTFSSNGVAAEKTLFVPYSLDSATGEESNFYTVLKLQATRPATVQVTCDVRWPATASQSHTKQPERHHIQRRVRQWTEGATLWAQTVPFRVDRWDTLLGNADEVRALLVPAGGEATFSEPGRAQLAYRVELKEGEEAILPFVLVLGTGGVEHLRSRLGMVPGWKDALAATAASYEDILGRALVTTPNARINRGLQWAKANTVRVQHRYRMGFAFTNDPPQDIVVVRDCAWYGLGADWLTPDFTDAMYSLMMQYGIHAGGKLTEYIHADTGQQEDYALNINDDTPLFVMGALHHYAAQGSDAFLHSVYPAVRQACEWIMSQRRNTDDGGGLVWCTVEGVDIWGNATWRNIIPGYSLAGAVTEINALCHAALVAAVELASAAGEADDAARFASAAEQLRTAINSRLTTQDGLYMLNLDSDGVNNTRTADLVFPLLGDVADPAVARRILDLLYSGPFYTPYGIHTVGTDQAEYHPNFGHGLMGGLWPNLTAWVAYAGRQLYPDRLAEMMGAIYALCEMENPLAAGHVVPGEFPEWFDGETWRSRGMAMSPWMPPTYLWLGVEGLAGVAPAAVSLAVEPNMPTNWTWLMLRNLPYRGSRISFFVHEGQLHTTCRVRSTLPQVVYGRDVTGEVEIDGALLAVALEDDLGTGILVASQEGPGAEGSIRFRGHTQSVNLPGGASTLTRWDNQLEQQGAG
ncbi:MAG: amylo-alpha-1,6-glucosidase [Chloroflexota bacterium]